MMTSSGCKKGILAQRFVCNTVRAVRVQCLELFFAAEHLRARVQCVGSMAILFMQ